MALHNGGWVVDSGASGHMSSTDGILLSRLPPSHSSITVGNGHTLLVTCRGNSTLSTPTSSFQLNNILVVPSLIRNLISVRQFTKDNNCTIEFDAFGFSVKDFPTRREILCCNSTGDLYTIPPAASSAAPTPVSPSHPVCGISVSVIPVLLPSLHLDSEHQFLVIKTVTLYVIHVN